MHIKDLVLPSLLLYQPPSLYIQNPKRGSYSILSSVPNRQLPLRCLKRPVHSGNSIQTRIDANLAAFFSWISTIDFQTQGQTRHGVLPNRNYYSTTKGSELYALFHAFGFNQKENCFQSCLSASRKVGTSDLWDHWASGVVIGKNYEASLLSAVSLLHIHTPSWKPKLIRARDIWELEKSCFEQNYRQATKWPDAVTIPKCILCPKLVLKNRMSALNYS